MNFTVKILGCNSALPAHGRHPSAQVLSYGKRNYLIDCGEGTQLQMNRFSVKKSRIDHIFISHLHGDHFFGLFGLLQSMNLSERNKALHVFGPLGLERVVEVVLGITGNPLSYELKISELSHAGAELICSDGYLDVSAFPMDHRIPVYGYSFVEREKRIKLDREKLEYHEVPEREREKIRLGRDFKTKGGEVIPASRFYSEVLPVRKYAYCSDTRPFDGQLKYLERVNTLYHEATFLDLEREKAETTGHTTALQAAQIAKKSGVKKLILGHFSSRYKQTDPLVNEARTEFRKSYAAEEGKDFVI